MIVIPTVSTEQVHVFTVLHLIVDAFSFVLHLTILDTIRYLFYKKTARAMLRIKDNVLVFMSFASCISFSNCIGTAGCQD